MGVWFGHIILKAYNVITRDNVQSVALLILVVVDFHYFKGDWRRKASKYKKARKFLKPVPRKASLKRIPFGMEPCVGHKQLHTLPS